MNILKNAVAKEKKFFGKSNKGAIRYSLLIL